MNIRQTEHALRAAASLAGAGEFWVLGTASILATHPDIPDSVVFTEEVDLWPKDRPELSAVLECIGEGSVFHATHGFYLDPYNPDAAVLPKGWEGRLVLLENANTGGGRGLCLEKNDLAVSKLARGDPKDFEFLLAVIRMGFLQVEEIRKRILLVKQDRPHYQRMRESPLANVRERILENLARLCDSLK